MDYPENILYTKEHEWIRIEGEVGVIGITDYAQSQLGDIVLVELPKLGEKIERGESCGVIESVKTVSDLYAPVNGVVIEVNDDLLDAPELLNEDPHGEAWIAKVKLEAPKDREGLMGSADYRRYVEEDLA